MSQELWLSQSEISRITRWPGRTIRHKVRSGELRSKVLHERRCRNGKPERVFAASSLPAEIQMRLAEHRLEQAHLPEMQMTIVPHAQSHVDRQLEIFSLPPIVAEEIRAAIPESQKAIVAKRYEIIGPLLNFRRKSNGKKPRVTNLPDGREIASLAEMCGYLAEQHGVSRASIWRWYGQFQKGGYPALADRTRSDKGSSRFFRDNPLIAQLVQAKRLGEGLSFRAVHEALARECGKSGMEPPSYQTVRNYIQRQMPRPFDILAMDGERAFHEKCAPYLLTDYKSMRPNQEWVSDHMQHDVWVRNDGYFAGMAMDEVVRPYLTAILDMRSRKCVGAVWCVNPSSHSISSALRLAVTSCGIPEFFYIDNGKDFVSIGKVDFSPEASGILARLGIQPRYCLPKHPQSKLIESWFGNSVHKRFDRKWRPFYCGASPALRPEDCALALKEHARLQKLGQAQSSPLPSASEFIELAKAWIEEYNACHSHSGRGMEGRTPNEVFEEMLPEEQRRLPAAGDCLAETFWRRDSRTVLEGGCIEINRERYAPADPESAAWMFLNIERKVCVACDPNDLGRAIIIDEFNKVAAHMECQKLLARGPVSTEDIRAGVRLQRRVRKIGLDYNRFVSAGFSTELDELRKRLPKRPPAVFLPSPPEVQVPMKKAVGQSRHVGDIVRDFFAEDNES